MTRTFIITALLLAGCGGRTIVQDRPVTVRIPVVQPCALPRPEAPAKLSDRTPDWDGLDVRQKAAWVAKHALELRGYGEQLDAATAACP